MSEQKQRESRAATKAAWIGFLGAVLGAVVAIVGPIHYQKWIKGPEEGRFALDIAVLRASDVDARIRDQVTSYPVHVKLWHRAGPTALGISVHLASEHVLTDLKVINNTEKATITLSPNKRSVNVEASDLRKGGIVQFELSSRGDPSITPTVQIKSGSLIEDAAAKAGPQWYESGMFFIVVFFILFFGSVGGLVFIFEREEKIDIGGVLSKRPGFSSVILVALLLSMVPFIGAFAIVIPILMIGSVLNRLV